MAADAETDGEDGVEVVVLDLAGDGALTLEPVVAEITS